MLPLLVPPDVVPAPDPVADPALPRLRLGRQHLVPALHVPVEPALVRVRLAADPAEEALVVGSAVLLEVRGGAKGPGAAGLGA